MNISATILAAGSSERMEEANKLLLPYRSEALIKIVSKMLIDSLLDPIFIVTGYEHDKVVKLLPKSLDNIIYNKDWRKGMSRSIYKAISSLPRHIDGNMIVLGDMPLITVKTLNELKSVFLSNNGEKIIYAEYFGKQANPVIFPKKYFKEMLLLKGDNGCKDIISQNRKNTLGVSVDSSEVIFDCDTKGDYSDLVSKISTNV
ncbi:MAG TPA: nucleotidyltransferase family protein [Pelagibacterales bacterium]|nr:nucleotidyltransferase family protein [Candidatus Neomarinimicrobiota bacterium]HIC41775.1 nucleotidyltransferase family protein [Pelagibacterales bacterium]